MPLRIFWLIILLISGIPALQACDVCGCVSSNAAGLSILPQFRQNYLAFNFSRQLFRTRHPASILDPTRPVYSREDFLTGELSGRYFLSSRWQLMGFVPYRLNRQTGLESDVNLSGPGDSRLMGLYMLIDQDEEDKPWRINWMAGLGAVLPTGRYTGGLQGERLHVNLQLGNGAWGGIAGTSLTLRKGNWGVQVNAFSFHFLENPEAFQPGSRATAQINVFRMFKGKGFSVLPRAGFFLEKVGKDRLEGVSVELSGGEQLALSSGFDLFFNRYALSLETRIPLSQHFATGRVDQQSAFSLGFIYSF